MVYIQGHVSGTGLLSMCSTKTAFFPGTHSSSVNGFLRVFLTSPKTPKLSCYYSSIWELRELRTLKGIIKTNKAVPSSHSQQGSSLHHLTMTFVAPPELPH